MKKRGQADKVFLFFIAAIVFAAIILFGYSMITKTTTKINEAEVLTLKTSITNDIARLSRDYGSVKSVSYRIPKGISKICFVDISKEISFGFKTNYPVLVQGTEEKKNFFLLGEKDEILSGLKLEKISISGPGYICFTVKSGRIKFNLEGKGDSAAIMEDFVYEGIGDTWVIIESLPGVKFFVPSTLPNKPDGSQLQPNEVKLIIKPSTTCPVNTQCLSDNFEIQPDNYNFNPPLKLQMPVPLGKTCGELSLSGIAPVECSGGIATFEITQT